MAGGKPRELTPIKGAIDWGDLAPLQLRARLVADGVFAGAHRSARRGAGVEFAGHRVYVPGDELRFIDVRASMRHERIVIRHFETETERALRLVVDATASMGFRSRDQGAPGSKLAYAALVAAALARISLAAGDPVGLEWIGGAKEARRVPPSARAETFERIVGTLEGARAEGDARQNQGVVEDGIGLTLRGARRGSAIVVMSDLLDLPDDAAEAIGALGMRGRPLAVVEILDPEEATFPFDGPVRLRALESGPTDAPVVQTDGPAVRAQYLERLEARAAHWRETLARHGGALVRAVTTDDPVAVVRDILRAIARPAEGEGLVSGARHSKP
jgi:uncharacterized protein (DUF58 family)